MNFLFFTYHETVSQDLSESLQHMGHSVTIIEFTLGEYNKDPEPILEKAASIIKQHTYHALISFNFLTAASDLGQEYGIPYISWIFDSPSFSLYSDAIKRETNFIFSFDKNQAQLLMEWGAPHAYHLPLAVNTLRINKLLGNAPWNSTYKYSVSFMGNLYTDKTYNIAMPLPEYEKGFLEATMTAQQLIYGYNLIYETITEEMAELIGNYVPIEMGKNNQIPQRRVYADYLSLEVTKRERITILNELARQFSLSFFTASDASLVPEAQNCGYLEYRNQMPHAFSASQINLNLSAKTITSGIPLRALDIMGAGGFLLSNYQPELDEYFVNGEEMVFFESLEDLLEKTAFYLDNERECRRIAERGYQKIRQNFNYGIQLEKILKACGLIPSHK